MTISNEGILDFFKKKKVVGKMTVIHGKNSDTVMSVNKGMYNGVIRDGNKYLNPVQTAIFFINAIDPMLGELNKAIDTSIKYRPYFEKVLSDIDTKREFEGHKANNLTSGNVDDDFIELFWESSKFMEYFKRIDSRNIRTGLGDLYKHEIKIPEKVDVDKLTKKQLDEYNEIKNNFIARHRGVLDKLKKYGNRLFTIAGVEQLNRKYNWLEFLYEGDHANSFYAFDSLIEYIEAAVTNPLIVNDYIAAANTSTESFPMKDSYLDSLAAGLGIESYFTTDEVQEATQTALDSDDSDVIVENQGPIEEITILQDNLTSATEAQIVLESLVSKLEDGLDSQSKPFVAITLQQFKEYGSVEVVSTETAKQLLSNLGKKIIEWLKAIWKKIVNLSKYIKTKLFNVFDRLRKIFTKHKETPVPKDFGNKRTPTGTIPVKNISVLIDNDSSNKVLSDTIGYNNFRSVTRNLKTLLDAGLLCCNKTLVKIRPLLANFDDIENGGTFRPEYLNDEKVFNFGCLKLITTVNDDTGHVNVSLHSELSIVDKEAEVAMYPATAKNTVPFEIDKYKMEFELVSSMIRRLENDRRITRAIKYFEENGDLTSQKSIYLKYITTACLSLSTLIVDLLNIVNVYTVYLEESDKYNSSDAA